MTFKQWQEFAARIRARAETAERMRHDRAWLLAASVGIPRDMCCLHNAAIDDDMRGWCHQNPRRLRTAKRANRMLYDYRAARLADSIIGRAFRQIEF